MALLLLVRTGWGQDSPVTASPEQPRLSSAAFITQRGGLPHVATRLSGGMPVTVAFLGGSITYNHGWRDKIMGWLRDRYPTTAFHFIAAGIPSLGSPAHAFRLQQDVLDSGRVDWLFIEAAVNDRGNGVDSLTQLRSLEGIVRHALNSNPQMDIVLMSFADELKTADYRSGIVPVEVRNHEAVAAHYGLPSIDLAREVRERIDHKEFTWAGDFKDLHPSPFGQELYFATMRTLLETCLGRPGTTVDGAPATGLSAPTATSLPAPLDGYSFGNGGYVSPTGVAAPAGWTIDPDWKPADGAATRPGFVDVPVLETTQPGAVLTFSFAGNAVGIAVTAGPDAGIIGYSVDGGAERRLDLFTPWSGGLHLPWYCVLGQGLKKGRHVLRLWVSEQKNTNSKGTACRIVHFLVNQ